MSFPTLDHLGPWLACNGCGATRWQYGRRTATCEGCGDVRTYDESCAPTEAQIREACRRLRSSPFSRETEGRC